MTEKVIDLLEAVEVEEEDGDAARGPTVSQGVLDAVAEQRPVRERVNESWKRSGRAGPRASCVRSRHGC